MCIRDRDNISVQPKKDLEFFRSLSVEQFDELFLLLKIDDYITKKEVKRELLFSLNILAWRIIGNAMEVEVLNMAPEYRNFDNPFLALQNEIDVLNQDFKENPDFVIDSKDVNFKQIKVCLLYTSRCV